MGISFSLPPLDWHTFLGHKSVKKSDFSIIRVKGLGLKNYFFKGHLPCELFLQSFIIYPFKCAFFVFLRNTPFLERLDESVFFHK